MTVVQTVTKVATAAARKRPVNPSGSFLQIMPMW